MPGTLSCQNQESIEIIHIYQIVMSHLDVCHRMSRISDRASGGWSAGKLFYLEAGGNCSWITGKAPLALAELLHIKPTAAVRVGLLAPSAPSHLVNVISGSQCSLSLILVSVRRAAAGPGPFEV